MAASDVRVVCFDPAHPENYDHATIFYRKMRTGLKWSSAVPGGDRRASWTVSCDILAEVGFPAGKSRVLIEDPVRGTFPWRGVLQTPKPNYARGRLSSVDYEAVGCADGSFRQFEGATVFGVTDVVSTVNGRQLTTNLDEIMEFGLTICPLIDGTQDHIGTGGALTEDTLNYQGHTAPQLWQDICNLTAGMATPFIWMVYPDKDSGLASLYFLATPTSPEYFEHGNSKENKLEIDYGEIANQIYLKFKDEPLIKVPATGDPIDETMTPDLQTHYMEVSTDIQEYNTAVGFASSLYGKFNQRVVTGGSIVLDRDIRTRYAGDSTFQMIPIYEVRAGKTIQAEITKVPYLDDVIINTFIASVEYDEDACQTTLSPSAISEQGRDARLLAVRGENSKYTWGYTSRALTSPHPDFDKIVSVGGTSFFDGFYTNKDWAQPTVPSTNGGIAPPNINRDPTGVPTVYKPNPLPMPITSLPPSESSTPLLKPGIPLMAFLRDGMRALGPLAAKIVPDALPAHRINIPASFGTADQDGTLDDGERRHTDVQEGFIDTFTISVLGGTNVTVTVKVDIYNWDLAAVRIADAFELTLAAAHRGRFQYNNSDDDHAPILLFHGDQLIWKVADVGADDDVILECALSGWKAWKEYPVLVGPSSVPFDA